MFPRLYVQVILCIIYTCISLRVWGPGVIECVNRVKLLELWGKVSDRIRGGTGKTGKTGWVKLGPGRGHQENTCFEDPEVGNQGKNHSKSLGTNFTGGGDC